VRDVLVVEVAKGVVRHDALRDIGTEPEDLGANHDANVPFGAAAKAGAAMA
jgi:hypothetical protein